MNDIKEEAKRCEDAFAELVLAVTDAKTKRDIPESCLHETEDNVGRFRAWCEDQHVSAEGQSALDFRLRTEPSLSTTIVELLQCLGENTREGMQEIT